METNFHPLTQRRLRADTHIRELTASVKLSHKSFIQPLFVDEAIRSPREVNGLNGVQVDTIDSVLSGIEQDVRSGVSKFLLFPVPAKKEEKEFDFSFAVNTVKKIKESFGEDVWIASDVCLCSYTSHGHCGILNEDHTRLLNNKTVDVISHYSSLLANAGADCIAPSDMMDGRIGAIRTKLNALGFEETAIMSYAAKFSSQFYGPFRDACHSAPAAKGLKNRKTYQVSPFNVNDAIASALRDEKEGADILMVKPATLYSDVIARLKQQTLKPVAAYHVSGEYAAIEALAEKKLLDREAAHLEVWTALQRSGADIIISYAARNAREWINHAAI
ncbi:MAG TPA: porphobilinogen synthase [Chitinophagaceae bacterium]|nr:porphobilinogen synthase [Chitinophagaceae bacterium]